MEVEEERHLTEVNVQTEQRDEKPSYLDEMLKTMNLEANKVQ